MSVFDPQAFLDATIDTPLERRDPLPVGDYTAVVGEVTSRRWTTDKPDAKTKEGIAFDVQIEVQIPPNICEQLGYDQSVLKLKDSIMLELNDAGGIDQGKGKNGKLRQYREAMDLNKVGDKFSPRAMQGRVILVKISHREWNNQLLEEVKGVARPL